MRHILRFWYFLSPGMYSIDKWPERIRNIIRINPFCELLPSYRDDIMFGRMPAWIDLRDAFLIGLAVCFIGYVIFRRVEGEIVQQLYLLAFSSE